MSTKNPSSEENNNVANGASMNPNNDPDDFVWTDEDEKIWQAAGDAYDKLAEQRAKGIYFVPNTDTDTAQEAAGRRLTWDKLLRDWENNRYKNVMAFAGIFLLAAVAWALYTYRPVPPETVDGMAVENMVKTDNRQDSTVSLSNPQKDQPQPKDQPTDPNPNPNLNPNLNPNSTANPAANLNSNPTKEASLYTIIPQSCTINGKPLSAGASALSLHYIDMQQKEAQKHWWAIAKPKQTYPIDLQTSIEQRIKEHQQAQYPKAKILRQAWIDDQEALHILGSNGAENPDSDPKQSQWTQLARFFLLDAPLQINTTKDMILHTEQSFMVHLQVGDSTLQEQESLQGASTLISYCRVFADAYTKEKNGDVYICGIMQDTEPSCRYLDTLAREAGIE